MKNSNALVKSWNFTNSVASSLRSQSSLFTIHRADKFEFFIEEHKLIYLCIHFIRYFNQPNFLNFWICKWSKVQSHEGVNALYSDNTILQWQALYNDRWSLSLYRALDALYTYIMTTLPMIIGKGAHFPCQTKKCPHFWIGRMEGGVTLTSLIKVRGPLIFHIRL
jgi:hypothetical protein